MCLTRGDGAEVSNLARISKQKIQAQAARRILNFSPQRSLSAKLAESLPFREDAPHKPARKRLTFARPRRAGRSTIRKRASAPRIPPVILSASTTSSMGDIIDLKNFREKELRRI